MDIIIVCLIGIVFLLLLGKIDKIIKPISPSCYVKEHFSKGTLNIIKECDYVDADYSKNVYIDIPKKDLAAKLYTHKYGKENKTYFEKYRKK